MDKVKKDGWLANRFCGKTIQGFEGADMILFRIFTEILNIKNGFYIDVGAFRPRQQSTTWYLYKKLGFNGINIEPSIKGYKLFEKYRKDDLNLCCLCGDKNSYEKYFYNVSEPSLSKISENKGWNLRRLKTLKQICIEQKVTEIDLLDINVEGYELEVLNGHNWRIKPKVINCEINDCKTTCLSDILDNSIIYNFIINKGYEAIAKTQRTMIYVRKDLSNFNRR